MQADIASSYTKHVNPTQPASGLTKSLTLVAMSLGFGVVQLDVTIVNTALDSIAQSIGGGVSSLQWIVNSYTICFAAFFLTAGALGDRIGARRVFISGFAIFTAASVACALAPNALWLVGARAVQGLGAAILVPNSLALLNHAYPDQRERGRAIAIWAAGASLALAAGPLMGGALIALSGWRAIFFVNLPIGLVGLFLAWRFAIETPARAQREIDLPGQVLAIAALGTCAAALIEGGKVGFTHPLVISGFVVFLVVSILFIVRERYAAQPMLPMSLFAHRLFAATALVGLLVNVATYGLIFVFSLFLQQINGFTPLQTGFAFLPLLGAVLPFNLIAPRVAERIGGPATIAAGAAMTMVACIALLPVTRGSPYVLICLPFVLLGAGLGLLVPPLTSTLLGSVDKARSGIAAGVLNATQQTGSVVGVALFGSMLARPDWFLTGMYWSIAISAAVLAASAIVILLVHVSK